MYPIHKVKKGGGNYTTKIRKLKVRYNPIGSSMVKKFIGINNTPNCQHKTKDSFTLIFITKRKIKV